MKIELMRLATVVFWASVVLCGPLLLGLVVAQRPAVRRMLRSLFLTACVCITGYVAVVVAASWGYARHVPD